MPAAEVIPVRGDRVTDLTTFCGELERFGAGPETAPGGRRGVGPIPRTVPGVIDALRRTTASARHQYFVWTDADVLLEANVGLFGQLANALMGVAAEREHVTPGALVLLRVIFVGGDKLGAYAEEDRGQFRSWLRGDGATPFREVALCVERPAVLTYRLDG
jgi:hypothetical protein